MKKLFVKFTKVVNKVLTTKLGRFLFEAMNTIGLLVLTIYMFSHIKLLFGCASLFFLLSNIILLVNKYYKNE